MGNALFVSDENINGVCLIAAIGTKLTAPVDKAIETARKEFLEVKNFRVIKNTDENYKEMLEGLLLYLTRKYNVGEGNFKKKTPIEYALSLGANDVVDLLNNKVKDLNTKLMNLSVPGSSGVPGGIEKVTTERVAEAKSKLEAFQANRKK